MRNHSVHLETGRGKRRLVANKIKAVKAPEEYTGNADCDQCGASVYINVMYEETLTSDTKGRDVIRTYMECPQCGAQYNVTVTNRSVRKKLDKVKQLNEEIGAEIVGLYNEYIMK